MHDAPHPLAGQAVVLGDLAADPTRPGVVVPGVEVRVEDWFDRVAGQSWTTAEGNPTALKYAMRIGLRGVGAIPLDDEVVYVKVGMYGHAVHDSELTIPPAPAAGRTCRECGCTDDRACADGCAWVGDSFLDEDYDLCTACAMPSTR